MKWSFSVAKIAGIDVRVHATFLLLLAWYGYAGYQQGGPAQAQSGVVFILLLFFCVLLHEFGHAFAARAYGIRTPDITLLPIGGVARLERMPENPWQELVIAIAGPLVNVVIALGLWLAIGMPSRYADFFFYDQPWKEQAASLLNVNVMLVVFNLIPAFPMDGGRMLRALLALKIGPVRATRIAARVGQGIAVIFAFIGVFGIPGYAAANPFLLFIAMFVFLGAQQEAASAGLRAAAANLSVGEAMITQFRTFPEEMPVGQAAAEARPDAQPVYPITDAQMRPVGMVLRNVLLQANSGTVGGLARAVPAVRSDASFAKAFDLMQQGGDPVLPVVNLAGQIVGLASFHLLRERAARRTS